MANPRCWICVLPTTFFLNKIICWCSFTLTWFGHCAVASLVDTQCEDDGSPDKRSAATTAFTDSGEKIAIWRLWSKMVRSYTDGTRLRIASCWCETSSAAGIQSILRKPLDPERLASIDCDKAEIFREGDDYRGMLFGWSSALYKHDVANMDVSYRKLCRQIVGPPPGTNGCVEWHEPLHPWNERVEHCAALAGLKSSSHYWKFAMYVALLPSLG